MQPMRRLVDGLKALGSREHYLFTPGDLRSLLPDLSVAAFKTLLSRAVKEGHLARVCRGLYIYPETLPSDGLLLFHVAARLRADTFTYISLETALSDAGVISQIPMNYISLISSGRSNKISCGRWGTIEFVHTTQKPSELMTHLFYDSRCGLWRANSAQALRDMRMARRNLDLIDWSVVDDIV